MFIQTQDTPNPATLKFIPGVPVIPQGTADFADMDAAKLSPLARRLFQVDGVTNVFLGGDFVAVTKADALDWFALKPAILAGIMEHYASGLPVIEDGATVEDHTKTLRTAKRFNKSSSFLIRGCARQWQWMAVILCFRDLMMVS